MGKTAFGSETPPKGELVGCRDHANRGSSHHREVGDVGKRRSEGDDLLDALGAALSEDFIKARPDVAKRYAEAWNKALDRLMTRWPMAIYRARA